MRPRGRGDRRVQARPSHATVRSVTAHRPRRPTAPTASATTAAARPGRAGSAGAAARDPDTSTAPRRVRGAPEREPVISDVIDQVRVRLDVERASDEERDAQKDPADRIAALAQRDDRPHSTERRSERNREGTVRRLCAANASGTIATTITYEQRTRQQRGERRRRAGGPILIPPAADIIALEPMHPRAASPSALGEHTRSPSRTLRGVALCEAKDDFAEA